MKNRNKSGTGIKKKQNQVVFLTVKENILEKKKKKKYMNRSEIRLYFEHVK